MTLQPIITKLRKSCTTRRTHCHVGKWLLVLLLATSVSTWAQSEIPEAPQWPEQTGTPIEQDADYLVPMNLELDLATDEAIPPPPVEIEPQVKPPTEVTDSGLRQPIVRQPVGTPGVLPPEIIGTGFTTEDEAALGLPVETNYYLPGFDGADWFQMEGLKFRVGPVHARISLNAGLSYNDNINGGNVDRIGSFIASIGTTIQLGTGGWKEEAENFALLTYSPSFQSYSASDRDDTINQSLAFSANYNLARYSTSATLAFAQNSDNNATQRGLAEFSTLTASWNNSYLLTAKTFAQLNFGLSYQGQDSTGNNITASVSPQIGYQFSDKLSVSVGPGFGYSELGDGGNQSFQTLTTTAIYAFSSKVSTSLTVGVEARQFGGDNPNGSTNFITPILAYALNYNVLERTSLSLSLSRSILVSNSLQSETSISNQFSFSISQRIARSVALSLSLGYQYLEYDGSDGDDGADGRDDQYVTASPSLSYTFWRDNVTLSIFYQRQQLASTLSSQNFDVNIYGSALSFRF